jgi:hypothetical protein
MIEPHQIEMKMFLYEKGGEYRYGVVESPDFPGCIELVYQEWNGDKKTFVTRAELTSFNVEEARVFANMINKVADYIEERG